MAENTPAEHGPLGLTRRANDWNKLKLGTQKYNAYIERCSRTVRREWRGQYIVKANEEAQNGFELTITNDPTGASTV